MCNFLACFLNYLSFHDYIKVLSNVLCHGAIYDIMCSTMLERKERELDPIGIEEFNFKRRRSEEG